MNRIDRLMAMTLFLQGRRLTKAEDLASHFEISLRTVYRDIAALGEAGVPIIAEAGVGYRLCQGYHIPPIMFTPEEAGALATAGVLTKQMTDASVHGPMQSALLKIRAVLPAKQLQHLERIEESTRLSETLNITHSARIQDVQLALAERRLVHLGYRTGGRQEILQRDVEPIGLVHYLNYWHLVAWCRLRDDVRDFRIDRISELKLLTEHFSPRTGVSLESVIEQDHCDASVRAIVHFQHTHVDRARREWSLGLIDDKPDYDGATLTFTTGSLDWLVGWLLSFQLAATVIDPPELREKMKRAVQAIQERLEEKN